MIVATGQGQRENALRAIALGAYDFCEKPVDLAVLRTVLDRALRLRELEEENRRLAAAPRPSPGPGHHHRRRGHAEGLPHGRAAGRRLRAGAAARRERHRQGGAGARAARAWAARADRPFVAINCAAIPENLLESELFGHERAPSPARCARRPGKIELANGGTLFLDEIGEMPASLQAKLLRFLQDQVFERVGGRSPIRSMCASSRRPTSRSRSRPETAGSAATCSTG